MRKTILSGVMCASVAATAAYAGHETIEHEPVAAATLENAADIIESPYELQNFFLLLPQETVNEAPKSEPQTVPAQPVEMSDPPTQAPSRKLIYILGDSIMQGAQPEITELLIANGWKDVILQASCGRPLIGNGVYESCDAGHPTSLTGLAQIQEDQELIANADQVIVALGTNDYASSPELFGNYVEQTVDLIRSINQNAPVHWVNTYLATSENYQAINTAIAESEVDVIDFAAHAPVYYSQPECSDGIHPCKSGYEHLAHLILAHLED